MERIKGKNDQDRRGASAALFISLGLSWAIYMQRQSTTIKPCTHDGGMKFKQYSDLLQNRGGGGIFYLFPWWHFSAVYWDTMEWTWTIPARSFLLPVYKSFSTFPISHGDKKKHSLDCHSLIKYNLYPEGRLRYSFCRCSKYFWK